MSEEKQEIFKRMSQKMKKVKETKQFNIYQHLLASMLLESQDHINCPQYKNNFFIMSPYTVCQEMHSIQYDISCSQNSSESKGDNYNALLLDYCILKENQEYIFGYDKYFFQEYPDFYFQDVKQSRCNIEFILKLQKIMIQLKIKQAFLPIRVTLTKEILLKELKMSELDILYCLNAIPPAQIKLAGLSVQFCKTWYAINYYSPLTTSTLIDIDTSLLQNSSVANYLANYFYSLFVDNFKQKAIKDNIKSHIAKRCYSFFQLFNSQPSRYRFDHTVVQLENYFEEKQKKLGYYAVVLLYPTLIFTCVFGVWYISYKYNITCGQGISWYSYAAYFAFGLVSLIIEACLFGICLRYVGHLMPELKRDNRRDFPHKTINSIKQGIIDKAWVNQQYVKYVIGFVQSQLSRFNYFTNTAFLYTAYECGDYIPFYIALSSILMTTLFELPVQLSIYFKSSSHPNHTQLTKLPTHRIDLMYKICNAIKFLAVAELLDIVSPSNSFIINNTMFNQRIINNCFRIVFHDLPFIIIQAYVMIKAISTYSSIAITLFSSTVMLIMSINKFLSITPSSIVQEDFNCLNQEKRKRSVQRYRSKLSEYESQMLLYNHYELLKCIRSQHYLTNHLNQQAIPSGSEQYNYSVQLAQSMKQFNYNTHQLQHLFENQKQTTQQENQHNLSTQNNIQLNKQDQYNLPNNKKNQQTIQLNEENTQQNEENTQQNEDNTLNNQPHIQHDQWNMKLNKNDFSNRHKMQHNQPNIQHNQQNIQQNKQNQYNPQNKQDIQNNQQNIQQNQHNPPTPLISSLNETQYQNSFFKSNHKLIPKNLETMYSDT